MNYKEKYLKYKAKYFELKKSADIVINTEYFFNFHKYRNVIHDKFENFKNFKMVEAPIKRVGQPSANGFINLINFKNKNYKFMTILKTSVQKTADNNYYEFVVGNCINEVKEYYPNFIYTFNYYNLSPKLKEGLRDNKEYNDVNLLIKESNLKTIPKEKLQTFTNIGEGCEKNDSASVLLEYVPNSKSLKDLNESMLLEPEIEMYNILFQVYFTLSALKNIYTHYDLHTGNVMFSEVPDKKVVKINYQINGKNYIIFTQFIPLIIDYGRSHINCLKINDLISSKVFSEIACENINCNPKKFPECDTRYAGLTVTKDENDNYSKQENFYHIDVRHKNESSDLRYLHSLMGSIKENIYIKNEYLKHFDESWILKDETGYTGISYGVKESKNKYNNDNLISTTTDCMNWLLDLYPKAYAVNYLDKKYIYGEMTINHKFDERKKWTFEKY